MASSTTLSPTQLHSLFDILTHHETYAEITAFKTQPSPIQSYGPPFQDATSPPSSTSPILQSLVSKFVLKLPGLREAKAEFWKVQVKDIIDELAAAELSESYDKGLLGVRKTLATAISALIEYPARGCLGGIERNDEAVGKRRSYDLNNPEDVLQSWQDCLQELVYGDLVDELFDKAAETDQLREHADIVQGMHEFIVVK